MPVNKKPVKKQIPTEEELIDVPKEVKPLAEAVVKKEKKERKPNAWLIHVKKTKEENPEKSYKECMSLAKETYKK